MLDLTKIDKHCHVVAKNEIEAQMLATRIFEAMASGTQKAMPSNLAHHTASKRVYRVTGNFEVRRVR
jgi:hypothetical protein